MSASGHSVLEIPVLETGRLRLRGHRMEDFIHSSAMWADPNVVRYTTRKPLTEEESWTKFLRYIGHWSLLGFGYWVVEEKTTGIFAGEIGFADYRRDLEPSLDGMPEIGWVLASKVHGKGFATEAVSAAVAWGDAHFPSQRTACIIDPQNLASIRVAAKCGYREFRQASYRGDRITLFVRDRMANRDH
jgi:RimJ/RimL family protein N-acetyltransferase